MFKMLRGLLLMLLCGAVSCLVTCPDNKMKCLDQETCCNTDSGYKCCHYPNAVCCADQAHCCPFGYTCDEASKMCKRRWDLGPMMMTRDLPPLRVKLSALQEEQAPPSEEEVPPPVVQAPPYEEQASPSVVHCDNYYYCPDGTSCCRYPTGHWWCCTYSPARCCRDGYHCCPYGYDCDYSYTHCVRTGVPHPFSSYRPSGRPAERVVPRLDSSPPPANPTHSPLEKEPAAQEGESIRCDSKHYCPKGTSCCQDNEKKWSCCPHPLGICCADGRHCCQYGYTCDPGYNVCRSPPLL